jgi:hypothetical protein
MPVLPNTTHVPVPRRLPLWHHWSSGCGNAGRHAVAPLVARLLLERLAFEDNGRPRAISPPRLPSPGRSLRFDTGRGIGPNVGFPQSLQAHAGTAKGKVKLPLPKARRRMGGVQAKLNSFLISALDEASVQYHNRGRITAGRMGGHRSWSPRFGEASDPLAPARIQTPDRPARSLITIASFQPPLPSLL